MRSDNAPNWLPVVRLTHAGMPFLPNSGRSCPLEYGVARLIDAQSGRSQFDPRKRQKVVGDNAAPHISFKPLPPGPGASVEAEGAFQSGDTSLDACPEVPEFLVHPVAFGHLQERYAASFREDGILDPFAFRKGKIVLRGEAAIGGHLPGHLAIPLSVLLKERFILVAVGRIAPYDETPEDHGGGAAGEENLVPVFRIPSPLNDDVGVVLEEGDDLLRGRDLLAVEHTPFSLIDDLAEDTDGPVQPAGKLMARKGVCEIVTLIRGELGNGGFGIALYQSGVVEKVPVGLFPYIILPCVEDGHDPFFDDPQVVAELILRLGDKFLALGEPSGDDADAVRKKGGVGGMVNVGLYRR